MQSPPTAAPPTQAGSKSAPRLTPARPAATVGRVCNLPNQMPRHRRLRRSKPGRAGYKSAPRIAVLVLLLVATCGCDREIDTTYAAVRGDSINGIAAFVQLLRDTGHTVTARQRLPAEIDAEVTTLVVFDHSFTGLDPDASELLARFTSAEPDRTLLLVLRDSDCVVEYLRTVLARDDIPPDRRSRAEMLLADFEEFLDSQTSASRAATDPFADGLAVTRRDHGAEAIEVTVRPSDRGAPRAIPARWPLRRRLEPARDVTALWRSAGEPLLVCEETGSATLLVLASAAPILNGGLVDPGNRLLAEDLAGRLPTEGKLLVAGSAEITGGGGGSGSGGSGDGDEADEPSPWRLLTVQPLPWVAAQALAAMALFCWCTAPIFGRPRLSSPTHAQDFGHHVAALANLFDKSPAAGEAFARGRLADWREAAPTITSKPRRRPRS